MTAEQLLQPRILCIAPDTSTRFKKGDLFIKFNEYCFISEKGVKIDIDSCEVYPHLFRKLEWWVERNIEDMPKWVKAVENSEKGFYKNGEVIKVKNWHTNNEGKLWLVNFICVPNEHTKYHPVSNFIPATEAEYLTYKTTNQ